MRLVDLHPRWVTGKRSDIPEGKGKRGDIGLSFDCPCCVGTERATRLAILFDPPIDDSILWLWANWQDNPNLRSPDVPHWKRTGETFETLTLSPSINAENHGHWHGFITNGEIR